ncbi:phage/plasmid primase, P4 family, partial [Candidatus Bathyarchaeota archaeon]|nr:phage/plasmid primase, P4 family [Candidatus Bathyarchaeota archaeon]
WKKWQTQRQTRQEFDTLPLTRANGFALICGKPNNEGLFLSVVDHDVKNLDSKVIEKGKEILKDFPITQLEGTANKGTHKVYYSRTKVQTISLFHDECALELLAEKKLCIMAPSQGYVRLNDNSPTVLPDMEQKFYEILARAGFKSSEELEIVNQQDKSSFQIGKLVDLSKLTKISPTEYQGSHPIHDSTTEKNFCVDVKRNAWFCFRHNSGGGALQYLAVKEGIIKCEQAKQGALRGKKFKQVITLAAAQGLIDEKLLTQSEINPIILAKDIMEDYAFVVDKESEDLYYFNPTEGVYIARTEQLIKREIARRLNDNTKARYYAEVENFIKYTSKIVEFNTQPELLVVQNGVLNVLTREMSPLNPEFYMTNRIPHKYNPEAKCPLTLKFLSEVMSQKHQTQHQEFLGNCLYRKIIFHVALLLNGVGNNGKSVLIDVDTALIGKKNMSHETLQALCYDKFAASELKDKMINFVSDMPSEGLKHVGIAKMIIAGDSLTVQRKHCNPFDFTPFAKLMFSCNAAPPVDATEDNLAWYRRLVMLDFPHIFSPNSTEHKEDKHLKSKLIVETEMSGYLNYALDGLERLMKNQEFSDRMSIEETRKSYIKKSDSCKAFVSEYVEITSNHEDYEFDDVVYRAFSDYCIREKVPSHPKGELTKAIMQYASGAERAKMKVEAEYDGGKPKRELAWRYLKLKTTQPKPEMSIGGQEKLC